jgi:hypothetical protein
MAIFKNALDFGIGLPFPLFFILMRIMFSLGKIAPDECCACLSFRISLSFVVGAIDRDLALLFVNDERKDGGVITVSVRMRRDSGRSAFSKASKAVNPFRCKVTADIRAACSDPFDSKTLRAAFGGI